MPLLNTRNLPITGLNLCLKSTYPIFFITVLVFKLLADMILYSSNILVASLIWIWIRIRANMQIHNTDSVRDRVWQRYSYLTVFFMCNKHD
jgi:hypothetical protein